MEDDIRERTPHRPKKESHYVEKNKYNDVHNKNHKSRVSIMSSKKDIVFFWYVIIVGKTFSIE